MGRHLGPVQARSVVMTEVVSLVHEVHVVDDSHGIYKIVFGIFRVTEGVLNPRGDRHYGVHGEKRNQHEQDSNSPIVSKDSAEINEVPRHPPFQSVPVLFITPSLKVGVWSESQGRPSVVRKIPKEVQRTSSIV